MEQGRFSRSASAKKDRIVRHPACKFNAIASTCQKLPCTKAQSKSSKCFIKITGSRYNGTFLLNVDDGLDDTIYHTMRDIEVALENQVDSLGKPRVSPKNCLSSVFRCFGTSDLNAKVVCKKRKKEDATPVEQSDVGPIMSAEQSSFNPIPETGNQAVMRDVVDVFQTTLNQFRIENMIASEVTPSTLHGQSQNEVCAKITQNLTGSTKTSREEPTKKVSFIRFSKEEVVVIQPPKPSNDPQELEVGIEVKPKTTAVNVGQSIKLAKEKLLIGVQDGRGVLQISEGIPKRTLQMVLEEDIDGKPSMKLSMNEDMLDENANSMQGNLAEIKFRNIGDTSSSGNNNYSDSNKNCFNGQNAFKKPGTYQSVESQVSWTRLRDAIQVCVHNAQYKTESTQCDYNLMDTFSSSVKTKPETSDAKVGNDNDESKVTCIKKPLLPGDNSLPGDSEDFEHTDSRKDHLPYLVHTLHEPMSYSSCFVSDEPSTHFPNSKVMRSTQTYKTEIIPEKVKPRKSIKFSSDCSSSSKCTKIFRNIREITAKSSRPLGWKDERMTTKGMDDFEAVLQNMCGSSYLYHNPEFSFSQPAHCQKIIDTKKPKSCSMSFDQWTQTDHNQSNQTELEHIGKSHKETMTVVERIYDSVSRGIIREGRRTKSQSSPSVDGSSIIVSSAEDELTSDSSDGASPTLECSMTESPCKKIWKNDSLGYLINGKANSSVGQTIFAAIEEPTLDSDLFDLVKKADSFIYPACRNKSHLALQEGRNISVVNMALLEVPIHQPLPEYIGKREEVIPECFLATQVDKWDQSKLPCVAGRRSSISPIKIKSKSCQNLATTPIDSSRGWPERIPCTDGQRIKLRYPQITVTDSLQASAVNVCGILNFSKGTTSAEHPLENIVSSRKECTLPSAIRQLLLPRQPSVEPGSSHVPITHCCNDVHPSEYWNRELSKQSQNGLFVLNETASPINSLASRRSLYRKTFSAVKTARVVVRKTFYGLFRKLPFADANKKKKNISDSLVYVAIPLEKKSENIRLYTKLQ